MEKKNLRAKQDRPLWPSPTAHPFKVIRNSWTLPLSKYNSVRSTRRLSSWRQKGNSYSLNSESSTIGSETPSDVEGIPDRTLSSIFPSSPVLLLIWFRKDVRSLNRRRTNITALHQLMKPRTIRKNKKGSLPGSTGNRWIVAVRPGCVRRPALFSFLDFWWVDRKRKS